MISKKIMSILAIFVILGAFGAVTGTHLHSGNLVLTTNHITPTSCDGGNGGNGGNGDNGDGNGNGGNGAGGFGNGTYAPHSIHNQATGHITPTDCGGPK